jgi:hypothetical protein
LRASSNRLIGALDYLCGQSGVSGIAGDDSILYRAIIQMIAKDAPAALDTLRELAQALGNDPNFAGTVMGMLSNRLRFDAAQTLTTAQKAIAIANLALSVVAVTGAYADLTGKPTLGTAAALNVGVAASNVVQLDGSAKLPVIDGSQLITIPGVSGLASFSAVLGADVALTDNAFHDGPSVAQGTTGKFFAIGRVSVLDAAAASFVVKLHDGTTVVDADIVQTTSAGAVGNGTLFGVITNPVGNLRISVSNSNASPNGRIKFNATGLSKDTSITVLKIG